MNVIYGPEDDTWSEEENVALERVDGCEKHEDGVMQDSHSGVQKMEMQVRRLLYTSARSKVPCRILANAQNSLPKNSLGPIYRINDEEF